MERDDAQQQKTGMTNDGLTYDALVDSDAFVGFMSQQDANHQAAAQLFEMAREKQLQLVTTSFVIAETATVLSARAGQALARQFLDFVEAFPTVHISEELQKEALQSFRQQQNKRTSVVDCANVVVMRRLGVTKIFSFDAFYFKKFEFKKAA